MSELTRRYIVMALATEAPFDMKDPDAPFVLKPWKDPAALRALETYRDHCYPELSRELDEWIKHIKAGPSTRGGVGSRNDLFLQTRAAARARPEKPGPRRGTRRESRKAKSKPRKSISLKKKRIKK
jgi:hypothetical protein